MVCVFQIIGQRIATWTWTEGTGHRTQHGHAYFCVKTDKSFILPRVRPVTMQRSTKTNMSSLHSAEITLPLVVPGIRLPVVTTAACPRPPASLHHAVCGELRASEIYFLYEVHMNAARYMHIRASRIDFSTWMYLYRFNNSHVMTVWHKKVQKFLSYSTIYQASASFPAAQSCCLRCNGTVRCDLHLQTSLHQIAEKIDALTCYMWIITNVVHGYIDAYQGHLQTCICILLSSIYIRHSEGMCFAWFNLFKGCLSNFEDPIWIP